MALTKKSKRELLEWGLLVTVAGFLYFTGLHTEVIGQFQRIILHTGIFKPDTFNTDQQTIADYDFTLVNKEGQIVDFAEFKNKTVFINMWATWCPPCIAEMPDIHDLYEKTHSDDIKFVMISHDQEFNKAVEYADKKDYQFPIYRLASNLPDQYRSQSIPTTFVISPEGKIVAKRSGMAKYDTENFREFLKNL